MAPRARKKRLGEGARCSVLVKLLRPSQEVAAALPNAIAQQRLDDVIATRLVETICQGQTYPAVFFTSARIPGIELSAALAKTIVMEEGHADGIWGNAGIRLPRAGAHLVEDDVNKQTDIGDDILTAQNVAEDIARVRGQGFEMTMTMIQHQKTSLPMGTRHQLPTKASMMANRWDGMALIVASRRGGITTSRCSPINGPPWASCTSSSSCIFSQWCGWKPSSWPRQARQFKLPGDTQRQTPSPLAKSSDISECACLWRRAHDGRPMTFGTTSRMREQGIKKKTPAPTT
jgi:hypothetical protein